MAAYALLVAATEGVIWAAPIIVAPFVGSFLGVVIQRWPDGLWTWTRSRCEACGIILNVRELVTILSFFVLRSRCRSCREPIARVHLEVELAAAAIAIWAMAVETEPFQVWLDCSLGWSLLVLSFIDVKCLRLPDIFTIPLIGTGLASTLIVDSDQINDRIFGASFGFLGFIGLSAIYRKIRGHDGLGRGDAKLLAAAGAWDGLAAVPDVVVYAAMLGIIVVYGSKAFGKPVDPGTPIPFGPYLSISIWVVHLCGSFAT